MNRTYDVIVIGLGGVGSAAACHLARRGLRVMGLDRYRPPHAFGSSHGQTRVIRQAYFEHPNYVPLLHQAYRQWEWLEAETGDRLFHRTGVLEIGPADGIVIPGVLQSAREHNLAVDQLTMQEAQARFGGIRGDERWVAVFEQDAGYLQVERCVESHLNVATQADAHFLFDSPMTHWQSSGNGVEVVTDKDSFHAAKLVIAAGPWANESLRQQGLPLQVLRKHMYWYETADDSYRESEPFPTYFFETSDGFFYGTPDDGSSGLKVARHSGGTIVNSIDNAQTMRDPEDQARCEAFLRNHLPRSTHRLKTWAGCFYTRTPDEHFIVDFLPDHPNVVVIAGLSGHGFKFTSALGKLAGEMICDDRVPKDAEFLGLARFH